MGKVGLFSNSSLGTNLIFMAGVHSHSKQEIRLHSCRPRGRQTPGTNQQLLFNPENNAEMSKRLDARPQKLHGHFFSEFLSVTALLQVEVNNAYIRQTKMYLSLVKNREVEQTNPRLSASLPLSVGSHLYSFLTDPSHVCYFKTPVHLFLTQENFLSHVCFSKTSFFFHLCAPAKHHLT